MRRHYQPRAGYYADGQYTWSSKEEVPDWDRWDNHWYRHRSEEGPVDGSDAHPTPAPATAQAAPAVDPTPKGADDYPTPAGQFCKACGHFVRGGRGAMRQHQLRSSWCLHRQGRMPAAREPCRYCGKMLAAQDAWSRQQHAWYCPAQQDGASTGAGNPPPAAITPHAQKQGARQRPNKRSPSLSSDSPLSDWDIPEHKRKQARTHGYPQPPAPLAPAEPPPAARRSGITCSYCGALVKGTGHPAGDEAALRAHQVNSSKCLAAREGGTARAPCPWGCGKLLANKDSWALKQHSWYCPCWQPDQPAT